MADKKEKKQNTNRKSEAGPGKTSGGKSQNVKHKTEPVENSQTGGSRGPSSGGGAGQNSKGGD